MRGIVRAPRHILVSTALVIVDCFRCVLMPTRWSSCGVYAAKMPTCTGTIQSIPSKYGSKLSLDQDTRSNSRCSPVCATLRATCGRANRRSCRFAIARQAAFVPKRESTTRDWLVSSAILTRFVVQLELSKFIPDEFVMGSLRRTVSTVPVWHQPSGAGEASASHRIIHSA